MISAVQAAELALAIYAEPADPRFKIYYIFGVYCGVVELEGCLIVVFRGSKTLKDWLRDFKVVPYTHPFLGKIHEGFWTGIPDTFDALKRTLQAFKGPIIVVGHSLGAAHAPLFCGVATHYNVQVAGLFMFAPPRPGCEDLQSLLRRSIPLIRAYHNCNGLISDPVPDVPLPLPDFPCCAIIDCTPISALPEGLEVFNPFAYHTMSLYLQGVNVLEQRGFP